jgi:hypothetical protein
MSSPIKIAFEAKTILIDISIIALASAGHLSVLAK